MVIFKVVEGRDVVAPTVVAVLNSPNGQQEKSNQATEIGMIVRHIILDMGGLLIPVLIVMSVSTDYFLSITVSYV